jgi:hypothetical protein
MTCILSRHRVLASAALVISVTAACGDDATSPVVTSPVTTSPVTTSPVITSPVITSPVTTSPVTTSPVTTSPVTTSPVTTSPVTTSPVTTSPVTTSPVTTSPVTTSPVVLDVVAVWPATDVVFTTPEAAASDFIDQVFRVEPLLGPFQWGDSRSGEFEVLTPLDDEDPATYAPAGVTLMLRQLGPQDGWFVIAAASEGVSIDAPEARSTIQPGPVEVSGQGRGFEGTVVVTAVRPGDPPEELDVQIAMTDWQTPVPFDVVLDLDDAEPGEVLAIIARGDTGIAATGEFAALPIIAG